MKIDIGRMLENRNVAAVLSLLLAIIMWFGVVLSVDTEGQRTITDVPVQIDATRSTAGRLDLKPLISVDDPIRVSVTISGRRSLIGNVTPEDIFVTARINDIITAGSYDLMLTATDLYGKGFNVISISPAVESIRFDTWVTRSVGVSFSKDGLAIPEDYVMGNVMLNPDVIELTGPDTILSQLEGCIVFHTFEEPLTETFNMGLPITFVGEEGEEVNLKSVFVSAKGPGGSQTLLPEEVQVTIPVLKRKTLPVSIAFSNVPIGFDIDGLEYELSESEIALAGPAASIDVRTDFPLGYIDMRDVVPGYEREMAIAVPSGYMNLFDIDIIRVRFPLRGYDTKELSVSNIEIINVPEGQTVTAITRQVRVNVVGPEDVLKELSAADFVAEINMGDIDMVRGQITVPVSVRGISVDNVWAAGRYTAVISVR